jgi:two-component system cell cycle sensor histidine kinase PleC
VCISAPENPHIYDTISGTKYKGGLFMVLEYFLYGFMILCTVLLVGAIVLYFSLISLRRDSREKDKAITAQLMECEKQEKIINSLTTLYDSAVEYDKNKTDFFSNIVHELKTPISVILGAIQLIESKSKSCNAADSPESRNYDIIRLNCYRLLRLANNLLDFARLDSGYLKLNLINCNLVCLVEEITLSVEPYARQKQIDLIFDTQLEEIITAVDMEKVERIVLNLLSNAIKFTMPGGNITVNTCIKSDRACISVKDTGIGIPEDKQNEIFERFQQVGSELSRGNEGSGIGLSLVKSFVNLHHGCVRIISGQQKGSEFIIELPFKKLEQEGRKETFQADRHSMLEAINIEFSDIRTIAS